MIQDPDESDEADHAGWRWLIPFAGLGLVALIALIVLGGLWPDANQGNGEQGRSPQSETPDTPGDVVQEEPGPKDSLIQMKRSRWLYSDDKVVHFRAAMTGSGPYFRTGDAGHGGHHSPGDGIRAVGLAEDFLKEPLASYWSQPDLPYSPGDPSPNSESHMRPMFAAWIFMTQKEYPGRRQIERELKDLLLVHADDPSLDFSDPSRYPIDFSGSAQNPIFETAQWLTRLVKARDMLGREAFSPAENDRLDAWLYGYANWIAHWLHDQVFGGAIPNRRERDYTTVTDNWAIAEAKSYDGGPPIPNSALAYSNRHASTAAAMAIAANYLKQYGFESVSFEEPVYGKYDLDDLVDQSRLFVEEALRFSLFPDGFQGDFERGDVSRNPTSSAQQGWLYSVNVLASLLEIAEYHAARGDMSVWEFGTVDGLGGTEGRPIDGNFSEKNLHFFAWSMSRYVNDEWGRTNRGEPLATADFYHDVLPASIASQFAPGDQLLRAAWRREGRGFDSYPEFPQSQGPYHAHLGEGAKSIGLIERLTDVDGAFGGE